MAMEIQRTIRRGLSGLPACNTAWAAQSVASTVNVQQPASVLAHSFLDLHTFVALICAAILVCVFGVMLYSIFAHRKSNKEHNEEQFHRNVIVEIVWTVVSLVILILMMLPATSMVLQMRSTLTTDVTVKVSG